MWRRRIAPLDEPRCLLDDPAATIDSLEHLAQFDFDLLLLDHGAPVVDDAQSLLAATIS